MNGAAPRIILRGSGSPADQIAEQLRGLIQAGRLIGDERLPSVRQLASDLGIAPGTVAKAYRALEAEGLIVSRIGSGTRVSPGSNPLPSRVLERARELAAAGVDEGIALDEAIRALRAVWPEGE